MPAKLTVIGLPELNKALAEIAERLEDKRTITRLLSEDMIKFAHVITGYLKGSIYYGKEVAGASAHYAGFEADRGDRLAGGKTGHDYAQRAIDVFPMDKWADSIVEPF